MKGLIFTYLMTYGGAAVALVNPFYGLLIYICFAIIRPTALWHYSVPQDGNYSRIVAIGLLAGWMLHGFGNWQFGKARVIVIALLGFFAWAAIGANFAIESTESAWRQIEEYAKIVLPFLVGITTIHTVRQLKQLALVMVACQGFLAFEFNDMYFSSPFFVPNEWNFGGLDNNAIAITMVTSLGLAGFMGLYATRWWEKLGLLAAAGLMVHVVLFSHSRGGMLAMLVTGAITVYLIPKRPSLLVWLAIGIAVAVRLAGTQVIERFETTFASEDMRDGSAQGRVELWMACIDVILTYPIFGIGSANWRLIAHNFGFTPGKDSHTLWLHVAAEMGLPGIAFLLLFYVSCVVLLWQLARPQNSVADPWLRTVSHMVIASIAGFAVSAQFVSMYGMELPYYVVLLGAAALKVDGLLGDAAVSIRLTDLALPQQAAFPMPSTAFR